MYAPASSQGGPGSRPFSVAGIVLASRKDAKVVWAKLPGHPFWPGLKVDLERDSVPVETMSMRKVGLRSDSGSCAPLFPESRAPILGMTRPPLMCHIPTFELCSLMLDQCNSPFPDSCARL